jgi:hypothetical protein
MYKKLLLSIALSVTFYISNAQFTVNKIDGTPFQNNEVIEFTSHSNAASELKFVVNNTSTENLDFRIRCMDIVNATGTNFQLCWAYECIPNVAFNGIYPSFQNVINAGANTTGLGDSFKNFNPGDGTNYPMDFSFRFFTRDLNGNNVGNTFNLTYRYQGPLSLEQKDKLNLMGVKVLNTYVNSFIGLEIQKNVDYSVANIQGQKILSGNLDNNSNLDLSSFQTGIYFLTFNNAEGLSDSIKIYKN